MAVMKAVLGRCMCLVDCSNCSWLFLFHAAPVDVEESGDMFAYSFLLSGFSRSVFILPVQER